MSKTIWVIEDGEYSDYRVVGVFTTKKNAELICSKVGGTIAEWPLDPAVMELSRGYKMFTGVMLYDGTTERMEECGELSSYSIYPNTYIWQRSIAPIYKGQGLQDCISGTVFAKNQRHAIKIFNEKRAQFIASGEFKPPTGV